MLPLLAELYRTHEKEIAAFAWSQLVIIAGISIARLPDPRKFTGFFGWAYGVFFAYASRASVTRWDEKGGTMKLPGYQVPRLEDVPDPREETKFQQWLQEQERLERAARLERSQQTTEPYPAVGSALAVSTVQQRGRVRFDDDETVNITRGEP
jgi:hypothetical protein